MRRVVSVILLGLALQACSMTRGLHRVDQATREKDAAFFEAWFGEAKSCGELRAGLKAEIEGIKTAQKKADEEFLAEQEAPAKETKPPRPLGKEDPLASLRDVAKKTKHAERTNLVLKARRCRTVDIEAALKAE
jgi:hypothetical protein